MRQNVPGQYGPRPHAVKVEWRAAFFAIDMHFKIEALRIVVRTVRDGGDSESIMTTGHDA